MSRPAGFAEHHATQVELAVAIHPTWVIYRHILMLPRPMWGASRKRGRNASPLFVVPIAKFGQRKFADDDASRRDFTSRHAQKSTKNFMRYSLRTDCAF